MIESAKQTNIIIRKATQQGKLLNQYLKIKSIGEGPYSKIKLMRNIQDGRLYAMKKYNLFILKKKNKMLKKQKGKVFYTNAAEEVMGQIKILRIVHHPHIARLIEILNDEQEEKVYLFLEYCSVGEIAEWSSKDQKFKMNKHLQSVSKIKNAFLQIAQALKYLHDSQIVHRDIKPQNILLDSELNIKVIDFGRAVKLQSSDQRLRGSQGTYHFMAPEMLSEVFPEGYQGKKCDMWSLGVTFYGILFQTLPFYEQILLKLFQKIEKCEYKFPMKIKEQYTIFISVIENLLKINPNQRLTASQLIQKLQQIQ